jgi:hypothetical protein
MLDIPAHIQAWVGAGMALVGALSAFVAFLWRMASRATQVQTTLEALIKAQQQLRIQVAHTGKLGREAQSAVEKRIFDLERNSALLAASLGEREKDVARLEGKMEQAHDDTLKVVSSLTQVMSSNDALWRSLSRLHPEHVPRRASDRG